MNHAEFINAMKRAHDDMPHVVFIDTAQGDTRFQIAFVEPGSARLEILAGNANRRVKSARSIAENKALDKIQEFGYKKMRGVRAFYKEANGPLSTIVSGSWSDVETIFKYLFGLDLATLKITTEKMDW